MTVQIFVTTEPPCCENYIRKSVARINFSEFSRKNFETILRTGVIKVSSYKKRSYQAIYLFSINNFGYEARLFGRSLLQIEKNKDPSMEP